LTAGDYGCTIFIAPGVYSYSTTIQLPIPSSGHTGSGYGAIWKTPINLTCSPNSTYLMYTGLTDAINQMVIEQNDYGAKIDGCVIDGYGAGTSAVGFRFGATTYTRVLNSVFRGFGGAGIRVQNTTGMNTNDWWIETTEFIDNQIGLDVLGPASPCSSGTTASSNAQHHWIEIFVDMPNVPNYSNEVGINAHCGVAFGRGFMHYSGQIGSTSQILVKTDAYSAIGPDFVTDEEENNSGGSVVRYSAPATSPFATANGTITLHGDFFNVGASTIGTGVSLAGFNNGGQQQLEIGTLVANQTIAQTSANITLTNWGTGASVTSVSGFAQTTQFTINSGSTGFNTPATVAVGLPASFPIVPICTLTVTAITGSGGQIIFNNTTPSATAPVFTPTTSTGTAFTPAASETYTVVMRCGP